MRPHLVLRMLIYTTLTVVSASFLMAQDLPSYMAPISGRTVSSPAETAMKNVLTLNTSMFELYDNAHKVFEGNILSKHPVILGLFSGAGGRFILYRPGMAALEAPSVPIVYQVLKSVDHSTMALAQVVGPYLDNPADQSWRAPMLSYRARMQAALDGLNEVSMPADWRGNDRSILQNNIAFMDDCLAKSAVSFAALEAFARKQAPHLKLDIEWAAQTQVAHWMKVLAEWKTMLGADCVARLFCPSDGICPGKRQPFAINSMGAQICPRLDGLIGSRQDAASNSVQPRGRDPRCARFRRDKAARRAQAASMRSWACGQTALRPVPAPTR